MLASASFAFAAEDKLLIFPDEPESLNVPAVTQVVNVNGQLQTTGGDDASDIPVRPGEVFILRKGAGTSGQTETWNVSE